MEIVDIWKRNATFQSVQHIFSTFLIFLSLTLYAFAGDYLSEYNTLKKAGDSTTLQKFLTKSAETQKNNPDYYATATNYYWSQSEGVVISTKNSEKGDFVIQDPKTGKPVGSISAHGERSPELVKKCLEIVSEGYRRFPERADLALGLGHIQMESELHEGCVNTMISLMETARNHPGRLKWLANGKLPTPEKKLIPETVQKYAAALFNENNEKSDALCSKLTLAAIRAFPESPQAYNMQAALASAHKDSSNTLKFLKLAHEKDPQDVIVLMNLADTYLKSGKKKKAKEIYSKVIELKAVDERHLQQAQKAIDQL